MIVYRLGKKEYNNDLSGRGAEINGGRWNNKGYAALYTASSRALAVLEFAVHVPYGIFPVDYYMTVIEVADHLSLQKFILAELPVRWNTNPIIKATQYLGDVFFKENKYLTLEVPSATVQGDCNYIINPKHPDFDQIKILAVEPFEFDSRLFNKVL